jgi:hypothetical protein
LATTAIFFLAGLEEPVLEGGQTILFIASKKKEFANGTNESLSVVVCCTSQGSITRPNLSLLSILCYFYVENYATTTVKFSSSSGHF